MIPVFRLARRIFAAQRMAWARGFLLAVIVLAAGIALLGLSGWFVTASGAAGLAGIGIAFDFFRPSAGVRFLAMGRAAARYGERVLTHDATLRSLADLRADLLARMTRLPHAEMLRVRGGQALNRITADVDTLDGLPLRLVVPFFAALVGLAATFLGLGWLVDWRLAAGAVLFYLAGTGVTLAYVGLRSRGHARRAEAQFQALRGRIIDMLRGQTDLVASGALEAHRRAVLRADARARNEEAALDRIDRRAGFAMQATATLAAAGVFAGGAWLAGQGALAAPQVALTFFAVLAMAEAGALLRRGLADYGRMADAARRICRMLGTEEEEKPVEAATVAQAFASADLAFRGVAVPSLGGGGTVLEQVDLEVRAGETLALTGRSGAGKSTLLHVAAGLIRPDCGEVRIEGRALGAWPERELRERIGLLPQRSALMSGSLRDSLALAAPDLADDAARAILEAVALGAVADRLGGLDGRLGEGGAGLSGGEKRRLALARVLARRPRILLLDEPTEGLDRRTAGAVLQGIRKILPDAAIVVAAHRAAEQDWADRIVELNREADDKKGTEKKCICDPSY